MLTWETKDNTKKNKDFVKSHEAALRKGKQIQEEKRNQYVQEYKRLTNQRNIALRYCVL
ncbi:MAG: hypothetical protein Q4G05_03745 [Clostridia bacterium]|nr:hypothetical protein [Clostridia bacterium]